MVPSESACSTATDDELSASWEGPTYARSRSVAVGSLLALLAAVAVVVAVGVAATVLGGSVSVDVLVVGGVLLLVGGPVSLLYVAIAYGESTDREKQSFRRIAALFSDDLSWLRPGWVGSGTLAAFGIGWWFSGTVLNVGSLIPLFAGLAPLLFVVGRSSYRIDGNSKPLTMEFSYGKHTHERSLAWLVGVRRLRLGSVSLFVCTNRGKRWYEGVHFLVVPESVDDSVEAIFRRAAETSPPRRVNRDERIIFSAIGTSMVGVGPFLYFLSSEPALLLILAGPSTLIGLGVVVHALRG